MGSCFDEVRIERELAEDLKYACPDFSMITPQQTAHYVSNQKSRFDPAYFAEVFRELAYKNRTRQFGANFTRKAITKQASKQGKMFGTRIYSSSAFSSKSDKPRQTKPKSQRQRKSSIFNREAVVNGKSEFEAASIGVKVEAVNKQQVAEVRDSSSVSVVLRSVLCIKNLAVEFQLDQTLVQAIFKRLPFKDEVKVLDFIQFAYILYNLVYVQEFQPAVYFLFADNMFNMRPRLHRLNKVLSRMGRCKIELKTRDISFEMFKRAFGDDNTMFIFSQPIERHDENVFQELSHFTDISFDKQRRKTEKRLKKLQATLGDAVLIDHDLWNSKAERMLDVDDSGFSSLFYEQTSVDK